jgi:hypothetical protein
MTEARGRGHGVRRRLDAPAPRPQRTWTRTDFDRRCWRCHATVTSSRLYLRAAARRCSDDHPRRLPLRGELLREACLMCSWLLRPPFIVAVLARAPVTKKQRELIPRHGARRAVPRPRKASLSNQSIQACTLRYGLV